MTLALPKIKHNEEAVHTMQFVLPEPYPKCNPGQAKVMSTAEWLCCSTPEAAEQ